MHNFDCDCSTLTLRDISLVPGAKPEEPTVICASYDEAVDLFSVLSVEEFWRYLVIQGSNKTWRIPPFILLVACTFKTAKRFVLVLISVYQRAGPFFSAT